MPRDSSAKTPNRRRFLQATGTVALASAVAGCGGDGGGTTTEPSGDGDGTPADGEDGDGTPADGEDGEDGDGTPEPEYEPPSDYPYGAGETQVDEAKRVMEEAGYGPDNRYQLDWIQYTSNVWKEMANTIRSRLSSAYIDMSINEASFAELQKAGEKGNHEVFTLGWIMDYPRPQNFVQLFAPENTDFGKSPKPNGMYLWWTDDAKVNPEITDYVSEQYQEIQDNPDLTDEAQQIRGEASVRMEEGNWDAAGLLPIFHSLSEAFWYDRVDYTPAGGAGGSRSKESRSVSSIEGDQTLRGMSGTIKSGFDPAASGDTETGSVVMNCTDAPFNYVNGTAEVENLLVESFEASDDLQTFTAKLKEGINFHGDWGELTAEDMVYSIRRVTESDNSTNSAFPISILGISHEARMVKTDDEGNVTEEIEVPSTDVGNEEYADYERAGVVDGTTAVSKTGEYEIQIELDKPFAYTTEVLAYSAFSALPEGIVGDISGYDGEMSYEEFNTSNLVGTGPFIFDGWESGAGGEINLTTNDDYFDGPASFDGISDQILTEDSAIHNAALNKNADIFGLPTAFYDPDKVNVEETDEAGRQLGTYGPLENGETVNYGGVATIDTFFIGFNMEAVPKAVREAMWYVVNQDQFVSSIFKGRGEAAYHITPPAIFHEGGANYYDHI